MDHQSAAKPQNMEEIEILEVSVVTDDILIQDELPRPIEGQTVDLTYCYSPVDLSRIDYNRTYPDVLEVETLELLNIPNESILPVEESPEKKKLDPFNEAMIVEVPPSPPLFEENRPHKLEEGSSKSKILEAPELLNVATKPKVPSTVTHEEQLLPDLPNPKTGQLSAKELRQEQEFARMLEIAIQASLDWAMQGPGNDENQHVDSNVPLQTTALNENDIKIYEQPVSGPSKTEEVVAQNVEETIVSEPEPLVYDQKLVSRLCVIFPEACPDYIKKLCNNKQFEDGVVDELIDTILNTDGYYPKRRAQTPEPVQKVSDPLGVLTELLPDADPDYLQMNVAQFEAKSNAYELIMAFVNNAMEKKNYPTLKDHQRRKQLSAQQKQYTTEFNVENFLKVIPDPDKFFSDPNRKVVWTDFDTHYAGLFLRNKFDHLTVKTIQLAYSKYGAKLIPTAKCLKQIPQSGWMKSKRKHVVMPTNQNIPLLQEIAFIAHEEEIRKYLDDKKRKQQEVRDNAKALGLLTTCNCCYDDEVLLNDVVSCPNGCVFCKDCLTKSVEIRFGEGKLDFPCLMNCSNEFNLQTLQSALSPKLFSKIAQKKAVAEVKAAGIEELEYCPFCDFATIPPEDTKVFSCLNPDCMKESCRSCKEPSHLPLRCDEIERDEEVKARVFVENKMTEALLKKCWRCGVRFFKEDGCNKMTCSCGAQMCYICGNPVTDYKHFNGQGGDRTDLCPLYSDNTTVNKENVLKGAQAAKAEIDPNKLKSDPSSDINEYYRQPKRMKVGDHHDNMYVNYQNLMHMNLLRPRQNAFQGPNPREPFNRANLYFNGFNPPN